MPNLSNFFQPLNFVNLLYFFAILIFFEILGTFVKSFFVKNGEIDSKTHIINWLLGLGFFIFVWFIAGFFIVPTQFNIQISVLILLGVSLPYYLKNKKYLSFLGVFKPLIFPIILFLPFLRPTFIKASLPPYAWDEMAYHFISPYESIHSMGQFWHFGGGGFYNELPRLMDNLYILSFSLTRTYSVVRFIQFSILVTAVLCAFLLIKKLFGNISSILFVLIFLSLPIAIPTLATIGYVDVVALSFLLLGLSFGITFLFSNTNDHLVLSMLFWAMSVGTKYSTLTAFLAFIISFSVVYWIKNKTYKSLMDKKTLWKVLIGLVIFGGYWYIKNFIAYGNPIYPFLFPCWGEFAQKCGTGTSFFGQWTNSVDLYSLYFIVLSLLPQNIVLRLALVLSPFLVAFFGDKNSKLLLLMLTISFVIEFVFFKNFSGFDMRFQQYFVFTLILMIIILFSIKFKLFKVRVVQLVIGTVLICSSIFFYFQNIININGNKYLRAQEINYALGKENIYDWIKNKLPDVSAATLWCDSPPEGPIALANFDPNVVWFSYSGLMRIFLNNCYYDNPAIKPVEWRNFKLLAKERKLQFWTVSIIRCNKDNSTNTNEAGDIVEQMFQLNNAIICDSTEVVPNLYYFDYKKLK